MTNTHHILVVEDDPAIRGAITELLEHEGYEVSCAGNGAEALALLEGHTPPRLILLDLMMPVMDGWAFRSAQRSDPRLRSIPVLVLSASHGRDLAAVSGLGADGYLAKPFDVQQLVGEVARLC